MGACGYYVTFFLMIMSDGGGRNCRSTSLAATILSIWPCVCIPACLSINLSICPCVCIPACLSVNLSICPCVCIPACLSINLSICPCVSIPACLSINLSICPCVCIPACLSINLSICPCVCIPACLSVNLSICPCVCIPACLSVNLSGRQTVYGVNVFDFSRLTGFERWRRIVVFAHTSVRWLMVTHHLLAIEFIRLAMQYFAVSSKRNR